MEFDTVRLLGSSSQQITLPLYPEANFSLEPYICKGIEGLDPPQMDIHLSETPRFPGRLLSRHPVSKEVIIKVGLNPYFTRIEGGPQTLGSLRSSLYLVTLSPDTNGLVTLQLLNSMDLDEPVALMRGYAKQVASQMFTQKPDMQITLVCPNPFLESPSSSPLTNVGTAAAPQFVNEGEVPVGFTWSIQLTSSLSSFTLSDPSSGRSMELTHALPSGSTLTFDTRAGSRGVTLTTGGTPTNLLGSLSSDSEWLVLESGVNVFSASSSSYTPVGGSYRQTWWGV